MLNPCQPVGWHANCYTYDMHNIITSQRYLDSAIVSRKFAARDFTITVSPEFTVDGQTYRVLLDGHHSLTAALEAGVEPFVIEADAQVCDAVALLPDVARFLDAVYVDSDWTYVTTGEWVW